jgi:hypothetical protein
VNWLLSVTGCLPEDLGTTAGVPQIAADLLQCSRVSASTACGSAANVAVTRSRG